MDFKIILDELKKNWRIVVVGTVLGLIIGILAGGGGCYFAIGTMVNDQDGGEVFGEEMNFGEGGGKDGNKGGKLSMSDEDSDENTCFDGVWVEVAGAVVSPDVYCVPAEQIMQFVIEMAGGIADTACETWVARDLNLAAPVEPDSKIYIPFETDPECGGGSTDGVSSDSGVAVENGVAADSVGRCFDGKININSASKEVLEELPGVGPSTAQKIIDGRPYGSLEDLLNVKGIGDATLEKIRGDACL